MSLTAGKHYPGSYAEMLAWFPTDAACLDYLDWLRWSDGFVCPSCASGQSWRLPDGRRSCGGCRRRVSATAGTIFHGTRTPLTIWLAAAWFITTQKDGASALGLKRVLGLGSYGTAWTMLHRYRTAMVRPARELLRGNVEVDETFIGGPAPGKRGRGAGGKVMVAIAVEIEHPTGFGRCRMQVIPNALGGTLGSFIRANVELGSVVMTDGLISYPKALSTDYTHKVFNIAASGNQAHVDLPGVHRVASLTKRWILSTYQGSVQPVHLQAYLDEFCFRFNRRNSKKRGMLFYRLLEQSVVSPPVTEQVLLNGPNRSPDPLRPPDIKRVHADTLNLKVRPKPWRRASVL